MVKLECSELSEGMVLAEPVFIPRTTTMLLNYGTTLSDALIHSLKDRGIKHVAVTERYTLLIEPTSSLSKELEKSIRTEILRLAPEKIEANTSDTMLSVAKQALHLVDHLIKDPAVLDFCMRMKLIDDAFLLRHGVETCAMSLLVGGVLNLNREEVHEVGMAGLLHDIGLCEMPQLIKKSQRNLHEENSWREHALYGYYLAREAGLPREVCKDILHHHESWNCQGFPNQIGEEEIPIGARIIAVCEQYNRLLLQEGIPHYQAIEYLYGGGNFYFDSRIVEAFTNHLAVYPLGSLVRLSTGQVGIVINVRQNLGPRPLVRVYYNRVNRPLTLPVDIDLAVERTVFIEQIL